MRLSILTVFASLLLTPLVSAQYMTSVQRIAIARDNRVDMVASVPTMQTEQKEIDVPLEGGKVKKQLVAQAVIAYYSFATSSPIADVRAYSADRKPISSADLQKRLQKDSMVFVCDGGQKADATYVGLLKPDTPCLFLPVLNQERPQEEAEQHPPSRVPPQSSQPLAARVTITADGQCVVRERIVFVKPLTAFRTADAQGIPEKIPVSIKQTETIETVREMPAIAVQGFDMKGNRIDPNALATALRNETSVLISGDDKPVDPAYLEIIKPGTLILVLPSSPPPVVEIPPALEPAPGNAEPQT